MNRPAGVTLISILFFVVMGVMLIAAIGSFVGGAFIGSMIAAAARQRGAGMAGAGVGAMVGAFIGIFFLVVSALNGVCGFGLWKLKEWARILTIILCGIGVALSALGFLAGMLHFHLIVMMWRLVWLAIDLGIIWYLLQPEVRAAFAPVPPMAQQAYPAR